MIGTDREHVDKSYDTPGTVYVFPRSHYVAGYILHKRTANIQEQLQNEGNI